MAEYGEANYVVFKELLCPLVLLVRMSEELLDCAEELLWQIRGLRLMLEQPCSRIEASALIHIWWLMLLVKG